MQSPLHLYCAKVPRGTVMGSCTDAVAATDVGHSAPDVFDCRNK
jgi:hypothetical protein